MNTSALILIIITIIATGLLCSLRFFAKKVFYNYFFWAIPSILILIYFILFRFADSWKNLIEHFTVPNDWTIPGGYTHSIIISKALLLDMCPFVALAMPLTLIIGRKRKIANVLAPYALFGGAITLLGGVLFDNNAVFSFEYIFLGFKNNELYFIMHAYLLAIGTSIMVANREKKFTYIIYLHIFAILYFSYIITISKTLNVNWNVTGTVENDWLPSGEYGTVSKIFNLSFPYVMILSFSLVYIFIFGLGIGTIFSNRKFIKENPNNKNINIKKN